MDRAARGLIFYAAFAAYIFYNFAWICGLSFSWNSSNTVAQGWFIGLCFAGDLVPLLLVPFLLRTGLVSFVLVLGATLFLGIHVHMLDTFMLLLWFVPKLLIASLGVWMYRGKEVDYLG